MSGRPRCAPVRRRSAVAAAPRMLLLLAAAATAAATTASAAVAGRATTPPSPWSWTYLGGNLSSASADAQTDGSVTNVDEVTGWATPSGVYSLLAANDKRVTTFYRFDGGGRTGATVVGGAGAGWTLLKTVNETGPAAAVAAARGSIGVRGDAAVVPPVVWGGLPAADTDGAAGGRLWLYGGVVAVPPFDVSTYLYEYDPATATWARLAGGRATALRRATGSAGPPPPTQTPPPPPANALTSPQPAPPAHVPTRPRARPCVAPHTRAGGHPQSRPPRPTRGCQRPPPSRPRPPRGRPPPRHARPPLAHAAPRPSAPRRRPPRPSPRRPTGRRRGGGGRFPRPPRRADRRRSRPPPPAPCRAGG
ncbi:hypothetical protein BU14_1338s0002, partial [Porphyra umbilicalis]